MLFVQPVVERGGGLLQTATVHEIVQRRAAYSQQLRGLAEVAVDPSKDAQYRVFLRFLANLAQVQHCELRVVGWQSEISGADRQAFGHDQCTLYHVLKFADIPWPRMRLDRLDRIAQQRHRSAPLLRG